MQQAIAYRQALSLLLAVKKPTAYLGRDRAALEARIDGWFRYVRSRRLGT